MMSLIIPLPPLITLVHYENSHSWENCDEGRLTKDREKRKQKEKSEEHSSKKKGRKSEDCTCEYCRTVSMSRSLSARPLPGDRGVMLRSPYNCGMYLLRICMFDGALKSVKARTFCRGWVVFATLRSLGSSSRLLSFLLRHHLAEARSPLFFSGLSLLISTLSA